MVEQKETVNAIYDSIAQDYVKFHNTSGRKTVLDDTFIDLMILKNRSDLPKDLRILDLACGDGYYTTKLRQLFPEASCIRGIDISSSMISLARQHEANSHLNIDYICADGKTYQSNDGLYDIITAGFYLHYSKIRDERHAMIKNIYDNLKTGGLFCSLNDNVCSPIEAYNNPNLKKHAVYREYFGETLSDGQTIQYTFHFDINTSSNCVFSIYHFSPSTYEELFKKCGFSSFE